MYHPTGNNKGGKQWQQIEDKAQDKAVGRVWEAVPAQAKVWAQEEVEEAGWVEEG